MPVMQRIQDLADTIFDPFRAIDEFQGLYEVEDPYPKIHALHKKGSVLPGDLRVEFGLEPVPFWSDYSSYMVFGYDNITRILGDAATFSSVVWRDLFIDMFGESITAMDAPEHTLYRRLFQKAFLPQTIAIWAKEVMPIVVNRQIDTFVEHGRAELVKEFTSVYPFQIIYDQLKLPADDRGLFHKLSVAMTCVSSDYEKAIEAAGSLKEYFKLLLDERKAGLANGSIRPDGDVISLLALADVDGERLPDEITISFLRQLFAAAGDNTFRSAGTLLVGLLNNPDQLEAVRRDRSLIPKAVEEALRWDTPNPLIHRNTTREIVLDGVSVPAGAKLDMYLGSANRDPVRFENPDNFDIFRASRTHSSFANGPHVCIGQHLARTELAVALNVLLDRLPNLRRDPDMPAPRVSGLSSRSPTEIHVVFGS